MALQFDLILEGAIVSFRIKMAPDPICRMQYTGNIGNNKNNGMGENKQTKTKQQQQQNRPEKRNEIATTATTTSTTTRNETYTHTHTQNTANASEIFEMGGEGKAEIKKKTGAN